MTRRVDPNRAHCPFDGRRLEPDFRTTDQAARRQTHYKACSRCGSIWVEDPDGNFRVQAVGDLA